MKNLSEYNGYVAAVAALTSDVGVNTINRSNQVKRSGGNLRYLGSIFRTDKLLKFQYIQYILRYPSSLISFT